MSKIVTLETNDFFAQTNQNLSSIRDLSPEELALIGGADGPGDLLVYVGGAVAIVGGAMACTVVGAPIGGPLAVFGSVIGLVGAARNDMA